MKLGQKIVQDSNYVKPLGSRLQMSESRRSKDRRLRPVQFLQMEYKRPVLWLADNKGRSDFRSCLAVESFRSASFGADSLIPNFRNTTMGAVPQKVPYALKTARVVRLIL